MSNWTLFSNHGHVLVCLARDSEARLRDVAADVGITERAVQKIVRDLQDGDMLSVSKQGRRNSYRIHKRQFLRHELEAHCTLGDIINVLKNKDELAPAKAAAVTRPKSGASSFSNQPAVTKPKKESETIKAQVQTTADVTPVASKPVKSEPAKPEPAKPEPAKPEPAKPGPAKPEPVESDVPASIEKQQGLLF